MKPFLKWAGGKYGIIEHITSALPVGNTLIEPFCGSGAVFLNTEYPKNIISDINSDIITLFQTLKKDGHTFIPQCHAYFTPENNTEAAYYAYRSQFNACETGPLRAALFLYLNRHGYNGLCRYNARGAFNVPFGRYKKPYFPERELRNFMLRAKTATFAVSDFEKTMLKAKPGDVIYCDPPYHPLSSTASFTDYATGGFDEHQQRRLTELAEALAQKHVTVVLSNHYTEFTAKLYARATHHTVFDVRRFISCKGSNRAVVQEILAVYTAN